eukprot:c13582_g1_i1.p1 GENE.c13582_g1_i1~~c13582_g1_i1.p1  ORF type:complete len:477 (+),score=154.55 c13582_g1_i1:352-1782(+)
MPYVSKQSDYWRYTVEGTRTLFEKAGYCVILVKPCSNIGVTVSYLMGMALEDVPTQEHSHIDPLIPHSIAVFAQKPESNGKCPQFEGTHARWPIECWRGLYGRNNAESAHAWGCSPEVEAQFTWGDKPWYDLDLEKDVLYQSENTVMSNFEEEIKIDPSDSNCSLGFLSLFGITKEIESEIQNEDINLWPNLPNHFLQPLKKNPQSKSWLQEFFIRLHFLLHWRHLIPTDMNMGWSRGTPLDRVFIHKEFFPYVLKKNIPPGRCLEWGNTYMAGDLKSLCPAQYEIVEHYDACGGHRGTFNKSKDYADLRPFHVSGNTEEFSGGFCVDIHDTKEIIPNEFFNLVISTFVFEHLHSPWIAAQNIFDMTAKGGYLLWAAPNIEIYHANAGDYWRYTIEGAFNLFDNVGFCIIKIQPCSTVTVTSGFLMGFADNDFSDQEFLVGDPLAPHTIILLAQRPMCDRKSSDCKCPAFEGINFN